MPDAIDHLDRAAIDAALAEGRVTRCPPKTFTPPDQVMPKTGPGRPGHGWRNGAVKTSTRGKVVAYAKAGKRAPEIAMLLRIASSSVHYHLTRAKAAGELK